MEVLLQFAYGMEAAADVENGKLIGLSPVYSQGRYVTRGRLGKGLIKVLGLSELVILLPTSHLAYLYMIKAHEESHSGPKPTLARSRAMVWVVRGYKLAEKVEKECRKCIIDRKELQEQRLADLPEERCVPGSPPWSSICLDLAGPMQVKAMVSSKAKMKVWPLLMVCQGTGAVHIQLMHTYGTEAFLLQWEQFHSIRGDPDPVVSDRGSQLTSSANYVTWTATEDPTKWGWSDIEKSTARKGTIWKFVAAGCQFKNGLAENRIKIMKSTLNNVMVNTLINGKHPTVTYAELSTILSRVANVMNDRPLGVKYLTKEDYMPITPNQLLIGRTSTVRIQPEETDIENYNKRAKYSEELLAAWWRQWSTQVFFSLLPYQHYKDARRHNNLRPGDICLIKYDGKIVASYRLCRVRTVLPDNHGVVRDVEVEMRKRDAREPILPYQHKEPLIMQVGVQRLVLITAVEDVKYANGTEEGDNK